MIDFGLFEFACPIGTGGEWFVKAAFTAGLKEEGEGDLHRPPSRRSQSFRVGLVRHPFDWLREVYKYTKGKRQCVGCCVEQFRGLRRTGWMEFVQSYLMQSEVQLVDILEEYKAEVCLRCEDFPWNVDEFFSSLGINEGVLDVMKEVEIPARLRRRVIMAKDVRRLRQQIVHREEELCERYEYF